MAPIFQEVHVENTNSCGYKCVMCPRDEQTRAIGFMSIDDFRLVLEKVAPFQGVFHLHGFGEALLDRKLISKIKLLKEKCPKATALLFSTLGVRVSDSYFEELLASGLNDLVISHYGFTKEDYQKIHGFNGFDLVQKNLALLAKAMKNSSSFKATIKVPGSIVSSSLPIAEPPEKKAFCKSAKDQGFEIKEWGYVHNYGDGRHYNEPGSCKSCPVLSGMRRYILNITWDLKVVPCAYDFNGTIVLGNLKEQTLEEIFSGPEYLDFVLSHQTNTLANYKICQNCERDDYR